MMLQGHMEAQTSNNITINLVVKEAIKIIVMANTIIIKIFIKIIKNLASQHIEAIQELTDGKIKNIVNKK
jgi:hypothetical protein